MEWEDAVLPPKAHSKAINVEKERKPKAENITKPNTLVSNTQNKMRP